MSQTESKTQEICLKSLTRSGQLLISRNLLESECLVVSTECKDDGILAIKGSFNK